MRMLTRLRAQLIQSTAVLGIAATIACGGGGGGGNTPNPAAPSPPTPAPQTITVTSFDFGPGDSAVPGQNTVGTMTLAAPAPVPALVTFTYTFGTPLTIPTVFIPANATTVSVPVKTSKVSADTVVTITASAPQLALGSIRTATLSVQAGSFLSFMSPPEDPIGKGLARRVTPADAGFNPVVTDAMDSLSITISDRGSTGSWVLSMTAPGGDALRSGEHYRNAIWPPTSSQPSLRFSGFGRSCSVTFGEFQILELRYAADKSVDRLHATFTQSCDGNPPLQGEIYLER